MGVELYSETLWFALQSIGIPYPEQLVLAAVEPFLPVTLVGWLGLLGTLVTAVSSVIFGLWKIFQKMDSIQDDIKGINTRLSKLEGETYKQTSKLNGISNSGGSLWQTLFKTLTILILTSLISTFLKSLVESLSRRKRKNLNLWK